MQTSSIDDELIDLIYAALLGEATWQQFLDRLVADLPDGKATLFMHDRRKGRGFFNLASGITSEGQTAYAEYFSGRNPWMPVVAARPVGKGVFDHDLIPREFLYKTEFYNDFLAPNEMLTSAGVTIDRDGSYAFMLTTLAGRFRPEETERMSARLETLAPHLKRASNFYRRGGQDTLASEMTRTLFDASQIGMIVWNESLRITSISSAGQQIVETQGLLRTLSYGRYTFRDEAADRMLRRMLDRLYDGERQASIRTGEAVMTMIRVEKEAISSYFQGPTVVALFEPTRAVDTSARMETLALEYHLSLAERRVLQGFIDGKTAQQIAHDAGRSVETIRSQSKTLYAKLHVKSRQELLRTFLASG